MCSGAGPSRSTGQFSPDQLVVVADAAGGDDHGLRARARSRRPAPGTRRRRAARWRRHEDGAADADGRRRPRRRARRPGGGAGTAPGRAASARSTGSRKIRTTSGPVPQVRWKRGTELPWPAARPSPRSAQPTIGHAPQAQVVQVGALLAGGELDVRLRPLPRPVVLALPVELAEPSQSCSASSRESLIPSRRCSGESTRKSPPSDQNACPPRLARFSWSSTSTRLPASHQLVGGDQPGETGADDDHVGLRGAGGSLRGCAGGGHGCD